MQEGSCAPFCGSRQLRPSRWCVMVGKSHANTQSRALDLFELFRTSSEKWLALVPLPWDRARAESICRFIVIDGFQVFLTEEYMISGGKHDGQYLKLGTILDYLGAFICQCSDRWKATGDDALKMFFTCKDTRTNTESAHWYRKLKARVVRVIALTVRSRPARAWTLCRDSVGALSVDNCRTSVGPVSASVKRILTGTMLVPCRPLSVCRDSVTSLSVCQSLSGLVWYGTLNYIQ